MRQRLHGNVASRAARRPPPAPRSGQEAEPGSPSRPSSQQAGPGGQSLTGGEGSVQRLSPPCASCRPGNHEQGLIRAKDPRWRRDISDLSPGHENGTAIPAGAALERALRHCGQWHPVQDEHKPSNCINPSVPGTHTAHRRRRAQPQLRRPQCPLLAFFVSPDTRDTWSPSYDARSAPCLPSSSRRTRETRGAPATTPAVPLACLLRLAGSADTRAVGRWATPSSPRTLWVFPCSVYGGNGRRRGRRDPGYVAQAGLELLGSTDPPASASQVAKTMDMHHFTRPVLCLRQNIYTRNVL
ncbi:PREDICTED: uncharacterized protein LOC106148226 [Chinchilla lanigera]|uniref:uncharacterized protein LOC106148226 n=1 Tax=Chinchilla lanigera TaxID=34839 RepID=UPI000698C5FC|nr:PREDICTED: uncharacterized protein LOC106148226 [Chinchilla lanigera]